MDERTKHASDEQWMQDMMKREDECGDLPPNGASGGITASVYHSRSVMRRRAAEGDPVAAAMLEELAKGKT